MSGNPPQDFQATNGSVGSNLVTRNLTAERATIGILVTDQLIAQHAEINGIVPMIGPSSSVNNTVAIFADSSGTVLKDSEVSVDPDGSITTPGDVTCDTLHYTTLDPPILPCEGDVVGPASATNNAIAIYNGTTGKLIQNSAVTIDSGTGDMDTHGGDVTCATLNYTTLNPAVVPATGDVVGPASAVNTSVALFDGTDGKLLQDCPVTIDPLTGTLTTTGDVHCDVLYWQGFNPALPLVPGTGDVVGPGSATDNAVVRFDGTTGELIQNSTVTLTDTGVMQAFRYITGQNSFTAGVGSLANTSSDNNMNTAIGYHALAASTTGVNNLAVGNFSLAQMTTGSWNVGIGYNTLNAPGGNPNFCVAIGYETLSTNSADGNIAIGHQALKNTTTGVGGNIAIGYQSLLNDDTGYGNVAIGSHALVENTTGVENTAIGYAALSANVTGSFNIAIGYMAGASVTGSGNVLIGYGADAEPGVDNAIVFGNGTAILSDSLFFFNPNVCGLVTLVNGHAHLDIEQPSSALIVWAVVLLTYQTISGTPGFLYYTAGTGSAGIDIDSTSGTDNSTVAWFLIYANT